MAMTTWYVVKRVSGYVLLEGSGTAGGRWMVKRRGVREFFNSRAEAEEFLWVMVDFDN
jgi:hypothetical protein